MTAHLRVPALDTIPLPVSLSSRVVDSLFVITSYSIHYTKLYEIGSWSYSARLISGDSIAIYADRDSGSTFPLQNATGTFQVTPSTIQGRDFRAHGRLIAEKGYYKFSHSDRYFLKAGANSPENFLAYYEFVV